MLEKDATKVNRWQVYTVIGFIATKEFASKLTVSAITPVILVVCWYLMLGPFFPAKVLSGIIALLSIAALTAVNALWRILPNEGREYLDMIEDVYGPRTRAEVWNWWRNMTQQVVSQTPYRRKSNPIPSLDVEAIAKQVGECPPIVR
jgi:hypothetical protein